MNNSLRIHLLGQFEINLNGESLAHPHWHSQQTQTIAKILFVRRGSVVKSDQLIEIVWPNDPIESARRRLHVRISQLRNALGDIKSIIQTVHGGYILQTDETCWLDIDEFQRLSIQGAKYQEEGQQRQAIHAYEQAVKIYRGDLLAEDIYADWTFNEREFFREGFLNLLIELSESYAQQGRYRLAIARARQALKEDNLRETIYVRLMLYHYYAGERAQALRLYERCREVLNDELGVTPLASTRNLVQKIKTGTLWKDPETPRYPPPIYEGKLFEVPYALNEVPFVSRDREYAWLISQWNDPNSRVILLEGEAGIGKSRLIETFVGYILSRDARVLHVRLSPTERSPLLALSASLRSLLTESTLTKLTPATLASLAVVFPELKKRVGSLPILPVLSASDGRQQLHQSISSLAAACASQPTLIFVDDAHRLNAATVDLLLALTNTFLVLMSFRSEETPSDHPIRSMSGSKSLILKPLTKTAIQSLIKHLSGQEHPEITNRIFKQSEGNPLFVVALLQHMFETGQLYIESNGDWEVTDQRNPSLPKTLRRTIETRLQTLNREQRRIIDFASVLGGEFDFNLLQHASKFKEDNLLKILDELIDAGLISELRSTSRPEFAISHDIYTELAYETTPSVRRKPMHLQAAQAIETLFNGQLDRYYPSLADHYDKAEKPEQASHFAILAGEQAAGQFAITDALRFLSRALELLPKTKIHERAHVRLAREKIYDLQGMRKEQKEDLIALEGLTPKLRLDQKAEIHLRRAFYDWITGNEQAVQSAIKEAIREAQTCGARETETRALILAGRSTQDQNLAIEYFQRAKDLTQDINQPALEGDITRYLGNAYYWLSRFEESQKAYEKSLFIHKQVGDLRGELSALNNLANVLELTGEYQQSILYYEQAQEICQKIGDRLAEGVILTNLGSLTAHQGNYSKAQTWLERAVVIRSEIDNEEGLALALNNLGDIHRWQGRFDNALHHYQKALEINTRIHHQKQTAETLNALSALYIELGNYQGAIDLMDQAFEIVPDNKSPAFTQGLVNGALLQHLLGDHSKALTLGEQALSLSEGLPALKAEGLKNMGYALVGLNLGEEAREKFNRSRSIYEKLGRSHLAIEPLAGLAQVELLQNNLAQAADICVALLPKLESGPIQGPDRVFWIYLICYQVLTQIQDDRALILLESANTLMNRTAANITDKGLRDSYLMNVSSHKRITAAWQSANKPD